jgi:hypothetical protein
MLGFFQNFFKWVLVTIFLYVLGIIAGVVTIDYSHGSGMCVPVVAIKLYRVSFHEVQALIDPW